jgi:predicted nucleotidyltransferase
MIEILNFQKPIHTLCKKHRVKSLYAFGSILTDHFNSTSDVDLVVEFNVMEVKAYADNYFALKDALQNLFNRPIDLLENQALNNPLFIQELQDQKILVYGQ